MLGQHALAYTAAQLLRDHDPPPRCCGSRVPSQAVQVLPLLRRRACRRRWSCACSPAACFPGWALLLAPRVRRRCCGRWSAWLLLAPQRRAPDPDENRPLLVRRAVAADDGATELRNIERELVALPRARLVAGGAVRAGRLRRCCVARFVYLQVVQHDDSQTQAENNRIAIVPIVPNRGLITDRNGVVLAQQLLGVHARDHAVAASSDLDDDDRRSSPRSSTIQPRDRKRFKQAARGERRTSRALPIRTRLTDEEVARFAAQRYRFPGVEIKARLFRQLPVRRSRHRTSSATSAASTRTRQRADRRLADETGQLQRHRLHRQARRRAELRARAARHDRRRGGRDRRRRPRGAHAEAHAADRRATTLTLSLDIKLQKLVEDAFGDRRGALVAIDPRTGDVLAFVSASPASTRTCSSTASTPQNWQELNESPDKPLLNRAAARRLSAGLDLQAVHGAGGARRSGKRTPQQTIHDPGFFSFGSHRFRDDKQGGHGTVDMYKSIVAVVRHLLLHARQRHRHRRHRTTSWRRSASASRPASTSQGELRGMLPSREWKRKRLQARPRAAEVVRRRDDLARHRPGLQRVHAAAARAGDRDDRQRRRRATRRTWCKRSRRTCDTGERARRSRASRCRSSTCKPEHLAVIQQRAGRREHRKARGARRSTARRYTSAAARPAPRR